MPMYIFSKEVDAKLKEYYDTLPKDSPNPPPDHEERLEQIMGKFYNRYSEYHGISWDKSLRMWNAKIKYWGKNTRYLVEYYNEMFKDEKEAAIQYNNHLWKLNAMELIPKGKVSFNHVDNDYDVKYSFSYRQPSATSDSNQTKQSKREGVTWDSDLGLWNAKIKHKRRIYYSEMFLNELDAIEALNEHAQRMKDIGFL